MLVCSAFVRDSATEETEEGQVSIYTLRPWGNSQIEKQSGRMWMGVSMFDGHYIYSISCIFKYNIF